MYFWIDKYLTIPKTKQPQLLFATRAFRLNESIIFQVCQIFGRLRIKICTFIKN